MMIYSLSEESLLYGPLCTHTSDTGYSLKTLVGYMEVYFVMIYFGDSNPVT